MIDNNLPETYEKIPVEEKKKKGILHKCLHSFLKSLYVIILISLVISSFVFFMKTKFADRKIENLTSQTKELQTTIGKLESKLEAAEKKRFDRVEIETIQIFKNLLASSNLTTYTYEYIFFTYDISFGIFCFF